MTVIIEDLLAKLDPKTRARVKSAQEVNIEKQATPSVEIGRAHV